MNTNEDLPRRSRSGYVAIIGRANVGKSTLLNTLLDHKLAIVSSKPHTTRHKLLGVINGRDFQIALLDTPGYLRKGRDQLDSSMRGQTASAIGEADAVVLVVEPRPPGDVETSFMRSLSELDMPAVLAINKVDTVQKAKLLPVIQAYTETHPFLHIVPISAIQADGTDALLASIRDSLPEQEPIFPAGVLTDRSVRFLCSEIIREKVFLNYEHEVPYDVAVEIDDFEEREGDTPDLIRGIIYVGKPSQKLLLIGKGGEALKKVGVEARLEIEQLTGRRAFVDLWVRVNVNWRSKAGFIQRTL